MTTETTKVEIKNRFTGAVIFTTEVKASLSAGRRLGAAVLLAVKARADLSGANLSGADLSGADLSGANLSRAYLSRADLLGADLSGADLSGANLSRANLSGADLSGANLSRANLSGANLSGAYLSGAYLILDIGSPDGYRFVAVKHDGCVMLAVGCRWFTFAGAVAHWRDREDRAKSRAALLYLRVLCGIEGWPLGDETKKEAA
jgi:hypothetical protein